MALPSPARVFFTSLQNDWLCHFFSENGSHSHIAKHSELLYSITIFLQFDVAHTATDDVSKPLVSGMLSSAISEFQPPQGTITLLSAALFVPHPQVSISQEEGHIYSSRKIQDEE